MAKSKRNKVVSLTKTKKSNVSEKKLDLVEKIQKYMNNFKYCYSFSHKNMTTMPMQELRNFFSDSKFVVGKNKVLQIALGRNEEESFKPNSFQLSKFLNNSCGLLFTDKDPEYIVDYFKNYSVDYYGTVGTIAKSTMILPHGRCEILDQFPSSMESQLKQLGLKVRLVDAKWYLLSEYVVHKEGEKLTADQARMIVRILLFLFIFCLIFFYF